VSIAFRVADVSFRYRGADRPSLRRISLSAGRGTIVGLLGPNGCGKTTLIRLLASVLRPTAGRVHLFPEDPEVRRDSALRRIATCFDRVPLYDALPGREGAVRLTALRGIGRAEAKARVERWLTCFDLAGRAGDAVRTYSLGMRRKLALVEAFAAGADLLLLDEPLAGLDAAGRQALLSGLRDSASERETAAVVAVHDPEFAASACDEVALLDGGSTVARGAPNALIRSLDLETTFEVGLRTGVEPDRLVLPTGVGQLATSPGRMRLSSRRGAVELPRIAAAIGAAGGVIRSIRVREPNLDDVFVSLTGRSLEPPLTGET
jgi:ABC-type multidrug transport system ATPase subunit